MGLAEVKKELKKMDNDRLIVLIVDLYKKNKYVKEILDFYANPNFDDLLEKYRLKVYKAFFPARGHKYKLNVAKQAISDFKKLEPSSALLADLMLYYVETAIEYGIEYDYLLDTSFYKSLETTYAAALKLIVKENLHSQFTIRVGNLLIKTERIQYFDYCCDLRKIYKDFHKDA